MAVDTSTPVSSIWEALGTSAVPARLVHPGGAVRLVGGWPTQNGSR
jgi:hypothetical protein